MNKFINLEELLKAEESFLKLSMPAHSHSSVDVLSAECCDNKCSYFLSRIDVLSARYYYVTHCQQLGKFSKQQVRNLFIASLTRVDDGKIHFVPLNMRLQVCPTLLARVFGMSLHTLMNGIANNEVSEPVSRPWYQKTIEALSSSLHALSKTVQLNSLNQLMLPPNYSHRIPRNDSVGIPISTIRNRMELNIRTRKSDTLVRCNACTQLPEIITKAQNPEERREAEEMLRVHFKVVSQQRVIIDTLGKQSRDGECDVSLCLMDSMSNKWTKLPSLVTRPKAVGDSDRIPISLTTVQLSESNGSLLHKNIEYPVLQTLYSHDSNFNLSVLMHGISKFSEISSTIFIIMDSSRNNKSFVFLGGIGYVLRSLNHVSKIVLVYPTVGHTHMSVDAHFGVISKKISETDVKDPHEFSTFISNIPSVSQVVTMPTIYNFSAIAELMYKPAGLCSNGMIGITKSKDGTITYCSSLTMNASQLVGAETDLVAKKLFKDEFYSSSFFPTVIQPDTKDVSARISGLIEKNSILFDSSNKENYMNAVSMYGKRSFRQLISQINSVPPKNPACLQNSTQDMHLSVLSYLEQKGAAVGRVPKTPTFHSSQLSDIDY